MAEDSRYYHTLYEVARTINSSLDSTRVLEKITSEVTRAMNAKAASIRLLGRQRQRLLLGAAHGLSRGYLRKGPIDVEKSGIDREVIETGEPVSTNSCTVNRLQYPGEAAREGIKSIMVVPLKVADNVIGVIRVYDEECREYALHEVQFLQAVADLSALAIENARLHEALKTDYELLAAWESRLFED
ncbi:MAG: GAF domain-containing protein [Pseudomonadota bacterium]